MSVQYMKQALPVPGWGRWAQVRYRSNEGLTWDGGYVFASQAFVRHCEKCSSWVSIAVCPNGHQQMLALGADTREQVAMTAIASWLDDAGHQPLTSDFAAVEIVTFTIATAAHLVAHPKDHGLYRHDF